MKVNESDFRFMLKPHTSDIGMTHEWHTDDIWVHTSDIRMTYESHTDDIPVWVTYGWHTSTYKWHTNTYEWHTDDIRVYTNDIPVHIDKIWAHTNSMQMTWEWQKKY